MGGPHSFKPFPACASSINRRTPPVSKFAHVFFEHLIHSDFCLSENSCLPILFLLDFLHIALHIEQFWCKQFHSYQGLFDSATLLVF